VGQPGFAVAGQALGVPRFDLGYLGSAQDSRLFLGDNGSPAGRKEGQNGRYKRFAERQSHSTLS
jgi:hypothetical protein